MPSDGYVRISLADLGKLTLQLLFADSDPDIEAQLTASGLTLRQAGYCEWIGSVDNAHITLGLDLLTLDDQPRPIMAPGGIGTNVKIISQSGYDLQPELSHTLLSEALKSKGWEEKLSRHLGKSEPNPQAHDLQAVSSPSY